MPRQDGGILAVPSGKTAHLWSMHGFGTQLIKALSFLSNKLSRCTNTLYTVEDWLVVHPLAMGSPVEKLKEHLCSSKARRLRDELGMASGRDTNLSVTCLSR